MGFVSLVGGWKEGGRKGDWAKVVERAIEARKWKMFTVGADVLHDYAGAGNELATLLLEYRKYDKELGTYLEGLDECADEHGFVHGNFSIHGTVTGRLSSSKPNLQNLSGKDENVVKCAFVSRFENGVMTSADLSQIELRIAACYYNDPSMQETYHKGGDIHKETAILISGLSREAYEALPDTTPDQRGKTDWRKRAKRLNFGIVYGIGADGLVGTLRKDGVHITEEQAQELIDRFFRVRPALARNIQRLMKKLDKQGYLRTFSGRWRRLPEAFSNDHEVQSRAHRQGVNFPIQDMASEMTLMSLVLIRKRLREKKLRSKLVLTIHDSIVADCPREEALTVASVMHECMERLPALSDEVFPGLDWSWLTVPVLAEVEVGHNFGVQVKLPSVLGDGPVVEDGKVMRMPNDDSELEEVLALCAA
jgi:DNA polymerase I-like protein with 3'-5' exonuclease and polymerase domains